MKHGRLSMQACQESLKVVVCSSMCWETMQRLCQHGYLL